MFKNESFQLDHSFAIVDHRMLLTELKAKLNESNFVVVTGGTYFIIEKDEYSLMALGDDSMPIIDWLKQIHFLPSSVVAMEDDFPSTIDWRRPVLCIKNKEVVGVLTAENWIKHQRQENRKRSAYFQTLAETISDSVTAVDEVGNVICWNSMAEETYKIKKEAILGQKLGSHFKAESIVLHHVLNEGLPVRGQYHQPNDDTHVLINASPIIIDNKIIGGVATENDITRMIRLNEELDSSSSILVHKTNPFSSIASGNHEFQEALNIAQKVAHADIPVHLTGESGSGKEMLAQAIHYGGAKAKGPFITINCSVIPPALLEIELFGIQKGSYTSDQQSGQTGKIEQALNGTLFIEDIDKMPPLIQEKLLKYLIDQTFYRVGGEELIASSTRIITSTSQPIDTLVKEGTFNEKLYYQLSVININIPPLRTRKEDIVELVENAIEEFSLKYKKKAPQMHAEAMMMLMDYDWPGNVRELRNVIERIVLLTEKATITIDLLPENIRIKPIVKQTNDKTKEILPQELAIKSVELSQIEEALRKTYGNKSAAASLLGISRGTLYNKIKEYGLS